jgi:3-oxoacyl-ACP reductase-like protein
MQRSDLHPKFNLRETLQGTEDGKVAQGTSTQPFGIQSHVVQVALSRDHGGSGKERSLIRGQNELFVGTCNSWLEQGSHEVLDGIQAVARLAKVATMRVDVTTVVREGRQSAMLSSS